MSEIIFDGVRIDEDVSNQMYLRILQAEYTNIARKADDSDMVKNLISIIEEEIDAYK